MATTLKEAVVKNSKVEGECRVWTGAMTSRGRPVATYEGETGKVTVDLHRHLAGKKFNLPKGKRVSIATTCGNPRCISPAHIEVVKVKKPRIKKVVHINSQSKNMELNQQVFRLIINHSKQEIILKTGISYFVVNSILSNTAMLPFFQIVLESYLGAEVLATLRESEMSNRKMREKYKISSFAVKFIKSGLDFDIKDEEEYLLLLSQCVVVGEHLLWNGRVVNGTPVAPLVNGALRNARKIFVYSITGIIPNHDLQCNCGFDGCINPWHLE